MVLNHLHMLIFNSSCNLTALQQLHTKNGSNPPSFLTGSAVATVMMTSCLHLSDTNIVISYEKEWCD